MSYKFNDIVEKLLEKISKCSDTNDYIENKYCLRDNVHYAVLLNGDNVMSIGYNHQRGNNKTLNGTNYIKNSIHAEVDALRKISRKKMEKCFNCVIVTFRIDKHNKIKYGKPCDSCMNYILRFNTYKKIKINCIYYSENDYNEKNQNIMKKIKI